MDRNKKKKYYRNAHWQIQVPNGNMLYVPSTNYYLLAAKQKPYQKACVVMENVEEFYEKRSGEWTSRHTKKIRQKEQ